MQDMDPYSKQNKCKSKQGINTILLFSFIHVRELGCLVQQGADFRVKYNVYANL